MSFDLSINLGHILTIVSILAAMIAAYYDMRSILKDHESRTRLNEAAILRQLEVNDKIAQALNLIRMDLAVIRDRVERSEIAVEKVATAQAKKV